MTSPSSVTYLEQRASLACLLCSRIVADVYGQRIRVINPEHTPFVRRLTCPYCSGRLWLSDAELVRVVNRRALTVDEMKPKRGRPPKATAEKTVPTTPVCTDCLRRRAKHNRPRCQPCASARGRERTETYRQVIAALRSGPHRGSQLADRIGVSTDRVRHLVHQARERGWNIVTEGKTYRLRGAA